MSSSAITDSLRALLAETPPFDHMPEGQRNDLVAAMAIRIYQPGEIILEQGTDVHPALFLVESGLVRLMDVEAQRLIDMCGPGSQFGSYGLTQGGILPYEARSVEQTVCALLSAEAFRRLLKTDETFKAYFDEDIKRYVRTLDAGLDASGAYLLFDTDLAALVRRIPVMVTPETPVQEAARAMVDASADTLLVVQDGAPLGVVTEGDLVERVVAAGQPGSTPVMALVERPPVTLDGRERLFDAVREMMQHRIRRIVVVDRSDRSEATDVLGLVTSEDIAHLRGLDPIATVEQLERAATIEELAALRAESNRRLLRLFQQGVQSEDLLGVIVEIDDQLKRRLLHLVERQLRDERPDEAVDGPWAWLQFGTPGRRESTLYARQDNGLVYADPASEAEAERARAWYLRLADAACTALERCGYAAPESGLLARHPAFCQPLTPWRSAFAQWADGADPEATAHAAVCFDVRVLHGEDALGEALLATVAERLPSDRLRTILLRQGTRVAMPVSFFGRFELERDEAGRAGLDLRARGLRPIVSMARALALDAGYLTSANTFDRLRHLAGSGHAAAGEAKALLGAFQTLADVHLLHQMQAAEVGETPSDAIDPDTLSRSRQNLLRETLKTVERVQASLTTRYDKGR